MGPRGCRSAWRGDTAASGLSSVRSLGRGQDVPPLGRSRGDRCTIDPDPAARKPNACRSALSPGTLRPIVREMRHLDDPARFPGRCRARGGRRGRPLARDGGGRRRPARGHLPGRARGGRGRSRGAAAARRPAHGAAAGLGAAASRRCRRCRSGRACAAGPARRRRLHTRCTPSRSRAACSPSPGAIASTGCRARSSRRCACWPTWPRSRTSARACCCCAPPESEPTASRSLRRAARLPCGRAIQPSPRGRPRGSPG